MFKNYNISVNKAKYSNGRTAIQLTDKEDGSPFATATINLPQEKLEKDEVIIKNYSENEGILDFLISNNIIDAPHRYITTGFVTCEVCKLFI